MAFPWPHRRGGSILTVPILVYLFSVDAVLATAYFPCSSWASPAR